MDKFSIYEILGIILPGLLFLFFLGTINDIWHIIPQNFLSFITSPDWKDLSIFFCFGFIFGMFFYTLNFELVKRKWFNKLFGLYVPTGELYHSIKALHILNDVLNKKAIDWYGRELFLPSAQFAKLDLRSKEEIKQQQGDFYDRAYYELEYHDKISSARSFQSFYFFFRQMVTVCCLLIMLAAVIILSTRLYQYMTDSTINNIPYQKTGYFMLMISVLLILCRYLARWNRKRMIFKMYYSYFIHIQLSK